MERRAFLGALTAPLIVAGVSAQTQAPPAAAPITRAPRKGRIKQGVTRGVFARAAWLRGPVPRGGRSASRASI